MSEEDQPDWVRERIADAGRLARFIAELDRRLRAHPARAPWATHLDYLRGLLAAYVSRSEEIVLALRGLERFTALEAEVEFERFLDVVRRALETLRSEDVLDGRPGAVRQARRERRRGQLAARGSSSAGVWILGATERAFPPPARQDPILLDDERSKDLRARRRPARAAGGSRERGGADIRARVRGGARAAGRLLRAPRDRGEPADGCPRCSSGSSPRSWSASACRPRRRRCFAAPTSSGSAATRSGRRSRAAATPRAPRRSARPRSEPISEAERDRTYLQARVTRPVAVATFERAAPAFARALGAERARRSNRYSEWDGALGPDALDAIASLVPPERVMSPTALENYAACPQRFLMARRAAGQIGRGAGADGADRQPPPRQPVPPDPPALRRGMGRRRSGGARSWTPSEADARDRRARSATAPRSAARPAIRRCGGPTGSR